MSLKANDILRFELQARKSLAFFTKTIFARAVELSGMTGVDRQGNTNFFVYGDYIADVSEFMQHNPYTIRVSARDHFKSTGIYAHFLWTLYTNRTNNLECQYFSYKTDLAAYHISKIKKLIQSSPAFAACEDAKLSAQGVIAYKWQNSDAVVTLEPNGLLSFKRGQHPNGPMYIDDPLKDPSNKLEPTVIKKINETIRAEILPMPHGDLHIVGTPQTNMDFFFDETLSLKPGENWSKNNKKFRVKIQPAILSRAEKRVLFPEWASWEYLVAQEKVLGPKLFAQEYLCSPAYSQDSYLERENVRVLVQPGWQGIEMLDYKAKYKGKYDVYAGFDIGKKAHPSHLVVYDIVDGKKRLLLNKWMDKWDYTKQVEYLKTAIECYGIDTIWYDATRGELGGFDEMDILPTELEPVNFNNKTKQAMATVLGREVREKRLVLIDDARFIDQLFAVNNDLVAVQTSQGHGDAFWSLALSMFNLTKSQPRIREL